jgi:hypothetical protein
LSPCTSINSKWIKDLNIKPGSLKLIQERARNALEEIGIGNDFLSRTQMVQQLREKINKWDYMKLKASEQQKKWFLNWRDCPQNGRKSLLAIKQETDNQNIQGAQKTKLPK